MGWSCCAWFSHAHWFFSIVSIATQKKIRHNVQQRKYGNKSSKRISTLVAKQSTEATQKKYVATAFLFAATQVGKPMPRNKLTMNAKHRQTDHAEKDKLCP
jgi:hypothetical protein